MMIQTLASTVVLLPGSIFAFPPLPKLKAAAGCGPKLKAIGVALVLPKFAFPPKLKAGAGFAPKAKEFTSVEFVKGPEVFY